MEAVEAPNLAHFIQVLSFTSSPTCTIILSAISVGLGFGFKGLDAIVAG